MKSYATILTELETDKKSRHTIRAYGQIFNQLNAFLNGKPPTVENSEKFILTKANRAPATIHAYRMALRTYFNKNEIEIPKGKLKRVAVNNVREDKFITRKEADTLYKCAGNLRDKTIVRLLYHLGLRASELIELNTGDLDLVNEKANVKGLKKSHKIRRVRFIRPELVLPTIRAYLESRGIEPDNIGVKDKAEPLILNQSGERIGYSGVKNLVKKLGPSIGKEDLSPHWLRHGFVVWNKTHGVPPEICAMQIGDTVKTTMDIYSHYSEIDVDRVYNEIQGKISEDKPASINPIDEIEELKVLVKGHEQKLSEYKEFMAEQLEEIRRSHA